MSQAALQPRCTGNWTAHLAYSTIEISLGAKRRGTRSVKQGILTVEPFTAASIHLFFRFAKSSFATESAPRSLFLLGWHDRL